jgi:hypothetical protein
VNYLFTVNDHANHGNLFSITIVPAARRKTLLDNVAETLIGGGDEAGALTYTWTRYGGQWEAPKVAITARADGQGVVELSKLATLHKVTMEKVKGLTPRGILQALPDNVQQGAYSRRARALVTLEWWDTTLADSHAYNVGALCVLAINEEAARSAAWTVYMATRDTCAAFDGRVSMATVVTAASDPCPVRWQDLPGIG